MTHSTKARNVPARVPIPAALAGSLLAVSALGASPQAIELQRQLGSVHTSFQSAASARRDRRKERFERLSRRWRSDTRWLSSSTEIAMHPAYQAIIGMGAEALPFILEDLRMNAGHRYWALKAIADEDPVAPHDRGTIGRMKAAWLNWGRQKGIIDG